MTEEFIVIDFETTGLSAGYDRIIEVAAAVMRGGEVVDSYVQLTHPGQRIPSFITQLTGISDAMVKDKPRPEEVMPELLRFLGDRVCVAHNATFDAGFFHAEMSRAGLSHERTFLCTMKLSRRLVHGSPNHKLGDLARYLNLVVPAGATAHRALGDVLTTAALWSHLRSVIKDRIGGVHPDTGICLTLMSKTKAAAEKYLSRLAECGREGRQTPRPTVEEVGARRRR